MRLRPRPVALVLSVCCGIAACGDDQPSDEQQVRDTLSAFAEATADKDYDRLCEQVLAPALVSEVERIGLPCETALERGLGEVEAPRLTVGRIRVDGDRASAEVRSSAAGQEPSRDVVELLKAGGRWRIASLAGAGAGPPSPTP